MPDQYRTTPDQISGMPSGIPYIIGNELAERFSFYGMKAILTVFMTEHLLDASGQPDYMSNEKATSIYHLFNAAAYAFPLVGAILSDVVWGKYKTILLISLMYCVGHGCLALMDLGPVTGLWSMTPFLYAGLALIAMGAGGIKPCVSAHVGDQFGPKNKHLLTQIFNWFYFSVNLGAAASSFLTPLLLKAYGPAIAFGLPGILMGIATFLFWLGRNEFIHVPPSGWAKFRDETFSQDGKRALTNLAPLFLIFVPVFWAIFDQTGSAWVLQAESLNRDFMGMSWLKSQVQVVNPVLILTLIPVFTYVVYPLMGKFFEPTPLRKIGIGFILTSAAFFVSGQLEQAIRNRQAAPAEQLWQAIVESETKPTTKTELKAIAKLAGIAESEIPDLGEPATKAEVAAAWNGLHDKIIVRNLQDAVRAARLLKWDQEQISPYTENMPSIGWQFLAYFILTCGEIMVSIVCLEFAYTQSPPRMKSFIMGVYFLGVALGNVLVSILNLLLEALRSDDGSTFLEGATYYYAFAVAMLVSLAGFMVFAQYYRGQTFIHGEEMSNEAAIAESTANPG